jgi:hypothetical protein
MVEGHRMSLFGTGGPSSFQTAYQPQFSGQVDPLLAGGIGTQFGAAGNIANNPYAAQAQQGAGQVANIGGNFGNFANYWPQILTALDANPTWNSAYAGAQGASGVGKSLFGSAIPNIMGASGSVLNTAFDPQQALYNRTQQQLLDQQNAINAMSGVASSPYGAGMTGQTMSNFNIDWQNQQLQRQLQGLQGAGQGYAGAAGLGSAAQTLRSAPSAMELQYLNAMASGTNQATGGTQSALSGLLSTSGAPYQTSVGQLGNTINAFNSPISNSLQYLNAALQATNANNQTAQMGFQDQAQGFAGLGNLLGLGGAGVFGQNGLFPGALSGLGSLFGGGAGAAAGGGMSPLLALGMAGFG